MGTTARIKSGECIWAFTSERNGAAYCGLGSSGGRNFRGDNQLLRKMTMFRIGQKVVCIDDSIPPDKLETGHDGHRWKMVGSLNGLKAGTVYTIRGAGRCFVNLKPVVFLEEIQRGIVTKNGSGECMGEPGFRMSRFRPLIEKKTETGMAILREILDRETITDKPPVRAALSTR